VKSETAKVKNEEGIMPLMGEIVISLKNQPRPAWLKRIGQVRNNSIMPKGKCAVVRKRIILPNSFEILTVFYFKT